MSTYSKTIIVGHLGNDPDTKHFEGGGQITNCSVATTETWKDKNSGEKKSLTEWHKIVFNGKLSEIVDKYVKKGDKILVEGKLRTRKWTDQANVDHYTTEIIAREMVMLGSKSDAKPESAVDKYKEHQERDPFATSQNEEETDDLPF